MEKKLFFILLVFSAFSSASCNYTRAVKPAKPSFMGLAGIQFFEVRRVFNSGLSFNKFGYQLEPDWHLYFTSDTTMKIYSPERKTFGDYKIYFDRDSIVNFANEYFRVKKVSNDSLVFQLLRVSEGFIAKDLSNIFMTFYSEPYMKSVLHKDISSIIHTTKKDTLFIRSKVLQAEIDPGVIFAARNPVIMKSKSPMIEVEKVKFSKGPLNNLLDEHLSDEYMNPEYRIKIHRAYINFSYEFQAIVDENGKIHFKDFLIPIKQVTPEFFEPKMRVLKGIIDIYLHNLLKITPGNTLGIRHASSVDIFIVGLKDD